MSLHLSKPTWITMIVCAVLLGIWPGVGLAQEHWTWFGALLGWMIFPLGIVPFLTHGLADDPSRLAWIISLGYPLAMLAYAACAYWVMRQGAKKRSALLFVLIAALISALASIPTAIFTMRSVQDLKDPIWKSFIGYRPALGMHSLILVNLLVSALLGWIISVVIFSILHKKRNTVVSL